MGGHCLLNIYELYFLFYKLKYSTYVQNIFSYIVLNLVSISVFDTLHRTVYYKFGTCT